LYDFHGWRLTHQSRQPIVLCWKKLLPEYRSEAIRMDFGEAGRTCLTNFDEAEVVTFPFSSFE
jgi:hypothetical protein